MVGLVSLALALKLEQAQLAMEFMYVLGTLERDKEPSQHSSHSSKSLHQKSVEKQSSKPKNSIKKCRLRLKAEDVRRISIAGVVKILKAYTCSQISKIEFMELE
jgi:hypothetical protein